MSNNFKNPAVPLISNPVNIDRPIQELQQAFTALAWLDRSFGRCFDSFHKFNGKTTSYPEVWQGLDKDLLNVLPNDNLKSQSFFKVEEPIEVAEHVPYGYSMMRARVSVIFWFNLKEIDPSIDYRYIELLRGQAQRIITNCTFSPDSKIEILRIWDKAENVFRGYDLSQKPQELLTHPYGGFRFECELRYREDCPDGVYAVPPVV